MTFALSSVYTALMTELSALAGENDKGTRLDRFLSEQFEALSRSRAKTLIKEGHVRQRRGGVLNPLHLQPEIGQGIKDIVKGGLGLEVILEPGKREFHRAGPAWVKRPAALIRRDARVKEAGSRIPRAIGPHAARQPGQRHIPAMGRR